MPEVSKYIGEPAKDWSEWLYRAESIPCAAYAIKNDENLTLLGGNFEFYLLFGCTEQTLSHRYGGRLSALLDAESLKGLPIPQSVPLGPIKVRQRLSRNGADIWLLTNILIYPAQDGTVLCCTSVDVTSYEKITHQLNTFEETVHIVADRAKLDYLDYDYKTGVAYIRSALSILPASLAQPNEACPNFVESLLATEFICPDYKDVLRRAFRGGAESRESYELQCQHTERGPIWIRLSLTAKAGGREAVSLWEDITQEKEAARSYLTETQFYQAVLSEKTAYAHVDVTADKVTRVGGMWNLYNEIVDRITYSQLVEEFIFKVVHPEDRKHYLEVMQRANFIQSLDNGIERLGCEFRRIAEQNKMVWMLLSVNLFRDPITSHVIALLTIQNINEKKQQELLLLHDSTIDQLTRLFNRRASEMMMQKYLSEAPVEELCAFLILDIDDFKQINDQRGHSAGDQMLVQLSGLLSTFFRRDDIVGRFGGDEFILLLVNISERASLEVRLADFFTQVSTQQDGELSCCAGITLCHGQSSYDTLFLQADQALYCAKDAGHGKFAFYQDQPPREEKRRSPLPRHHITQGSSLDMLSKSNKLNIFLTEDGKIDSFDSLIGTQGDIAYLVNPNTFELICANQAFYDRLGMMPSQIEGMKCYEAMHKRDMPCPFCSKANWSTDKFYLWRNQNTSLEQEFLIKNKLVNWGGKEAMLAIAVDISNDKSIVDSMDNSATETHSILGGVQHMAAAPTLSGMLCSAMEAIGNFFRASSVTFWQPLPDGQGYSCTHFWSRNGERPSAGNGGHTVNQWLESCNWGQIVMVESPEAMLGHSYDMYLYMKEHGICNQRWTRVSEDGVPLGFIAIDNSSSNLQSVAFLESFTVFIANELRNRRLIENAIYAEKHDNLTDLLSRKSFEDFAVTYAPDQIACIGILMANINNLNGTNVTRGFHTGNYLIRLFADILREVFTKCDIYRLNGDEFLVILMETPRSELENGVAELEDRVTQNGMFTVSIGHSWDDVENDLYVLMEQATQAMKLHKKRHYDAMPTTMVTERRKMLNDLMNSVEKGSFEVFLQPKVNLLHGNMMGAEALIRYKHEEKGYVMPAQFIDILEKNSLIRYIDLFVFEEVCKLLEKWKLAGLFLPVISLNFSRLTLLEQDIVACVEAIITRYDVPRKFIEIEITESVSNMGKSILFQNTHDLHEAGFAIALDDFGTKYTNLAILADLDFNILKVDKSLVSALDGHSNRQIIIKNIIAMCEDLGITTLAEGIETKAQEEILQQLHCCIGQGYLYGKPMPIALFEQRYIQINSELQQEQSYSHSNLIE